MDKATAEAIALAERDALLRQSRLGEAPPRPAITLDEAFARGWLEHWQHLAYGAQVKYHIRDLLRLLGGETELHALTDATIVDYVARRRAEPSKRSGRTVRGPDGRPRKEGQQLVSATTVNRELEALAALLRLAERWQVRLPEGLDVRAHRLKAKSRREVYLGKDEAAALLQAVVPHARAPLVLELTTGLRRGNVLGLAWSDVHLDTSDPYIEVRQKGDRPHVVPLLPAAIAALTSIAPTNKQRRGPVFRFGQAGCGCVWCRNPDWQGTQIKSIRRTFETARKAIGREDLTFHDLRHSLAGWLLKDGGSLRLVQEQLGHASIRTTERYTHLERSFRARALEKALSSAEFGTISAHDKDDDLNEAG